MKDRLDSEVEAAGMTRSAATGCDAAPGRMGRGRRHPARSASSASCARWSCDRPFTLLVVEMVVVGIVMPVMFLTVGESTLKKDYLSWLDKATTRCRRT